MAQPDAHPPAGDPLASPPITSYDENPAIVDAHKTFLITFFSIVAFIVAVVTFII